MLCFWVLLFLKTEDSFLTPSRINKGQAWNYTFWSIKFKCVHKFKYVLGTYDETKSFLKVYYPTISHFNEISLIELQVWLIAWN